MVGQPPSASPAPRRSRSRAGPGGGACPAPAAVLARRSRRAATNINAGSFSPLTTTLTPRRRRTADPVGDAALPAGPLGVALGRELCGEAAGQRGHVRPGTARSAKRSSAWASAATRSRSPAGRSTSPARTRAPRSACRSSTPRRRDRSTSRKADRSMVRAKIEVDPLTAALTVTTNSSMPGLRSRRSSKGSRCRSSTSTSRQPARVHVQPDELRTDGDQRRPSQAPKARPRPYPCPSRSTNCARLKFAPEIRGLHVRENQQSRRGEPVAKLSYPQRAARHPGEHRQDQSRPAQAVALPADHAAEGVSGRCVRNEPR